VSKANSTRVISSSYLKMHRINLNGILKTLFSNENRDEFQEGKNQNLYMVALKRFCQETLNTWCVKSANFF
jgi:hypothetical protein